MKDFDEHLKELERPPGKGNLMLPFFGSTNLECPWLHFGLSDPKHEEVELEGLLLMQDWGTHNEKRPENLTLATNYIVDSFKIIREEDPTMRNLLDSKRGWHTAIKSRRWLVSNAVWGLRPPKNGEPAPMCGYLGAKTHKQSFATWGKLVVRLSAEIEHFKLIVAGEWATFKDFPGDTNTENLGRYLLRWHKWVTTGREPVADLPEELSEKKLKDCRGSVVYVRHPSTWGSQPACENGPPK